MTTKCDRNQPFETIEPKMFRPRKTVPFGSIDPSQVITDDDYPSIEYDDVAVGDINSDAKGSGARKNRGKNARLELVPVSFWRDRWEPFLHRQASDLLYRLSFFQDGTGDRDLQAWLTMYCPEEWMDEAVAVLTFGADKYKAWNWAKGMPWSVCVGCILRHIRAIVDVEKAGGDGLAARDPESGLLHIGHAVCNVIFLEYYRTHYPEGDDRPPRYEETS